jgi:predicted DNA-binding protein (MmcQ/YjbR family)
LLLNKDIEAIHELWGFISWAPSSIIDFCLSAAKDYYIEDNAQIYASYILMFRMANVRNPNAAIIHFGRENYPEDTLLTLLTSSYKHTYNILPSNIKQNILIETALHLETSKRNYQRDIELTGKKIFPAFELKKTHGQNEYYPFDDEEDVWKKKWRAMGGLLYKGRMIALKDNEIWKKLSMFSRPYPPYNFGSGMNLSNISRNECIKFGLLKQTLAQCLKKRLISKNIKITIVK